MVRAIGLFLVFPYLLFTLITHCFQEVSQGCAIEGHESLIGTTATPKETTEAPTTRFTIQTPKPQRRRRDLEQGHFTFYMIFSETNGE